MAKESSTTQLELIFSRLDGKSLARAQAVCREWRIVAGSLEVRKSRFMREWGVLKVTGTSRYNNTLEASTISSFVLAHPVEKYDTLAGLALRYRCSTLNLRVVNGLASEWVLKARRMVFVPAQPEMLPGATVDIQFSDDASREVLVVKPREKDPLSNGAELDETTLHEGLQEMKISSTHASGNTNGVSFSRRMIASSLAKELYIDTTAALFYLQTSDWDLSKAKRQFLADGCFVQGRRY